jgi:hypothetical protein
MTCEVWKETKMAAKTIRKFDHLVEIGPGATGSIAFRFPKDQRRSFDVTLAAAEPSTGIVELVLDNLTRGYEMSQYTEGEAEQPWNPLLPDARGEIRATLNLNAGERIGIDSDGLVAHSLHLVGVRWVGDRLQMRFQESA